MRKPDASISVWVALTAGSALVALFQVLVFGRSVGQAALGFAWGTIGAIVVACVVDVAGRGEE
jgi:hypothetical protein